MRRRIGGSVVVITGASRGIGRATARLFAERGASVVLAARREDALLGVAAECEARGGRALAVPTDVADFRAVEELARRAVEHFGRIDVWVNNAVLAAVGSPEKIARAVVRCAERPRPEMVVGNSVRTLKLTHALFPKLVERAVARTVEKGFLRDEPEEETYDNLFEPKGEWTGTDGGFNEEARHQRSGAARRAAVAGASVLGPGLLAWLLLRARKRL